MHRFSEPTGPSPAGRDVTEIAVASWEIECCAPPPVVGETSSWTLQFISPAAGGTREFERERTWRVVSRGEVTTLVDGAVTAYWTAVNGPPPPPGTTRLRGYLAGTVHGGSVPDDAPRVSGVVRRIRLVAQQFTLQERHGERVLQPVPGTLTLVDVHRSPRWFASPLPDPGTGRTATSQTGVLLDLAVARDATP